MGCFDLVDEEKMRGKLATRTKISVVSERGLKWNILLTIVLPCSLNVSHF